MSVKYLCFNFQNCVAEALCGLSQASKVDPFARIVNISELTLLTISAEASLKMFEGASINLISHQSCKHYESITAAFSLLYFFHLKFVDPMNFLFHKLEYAIKKIGRA